jgi:hypothetical protein
MAKFCSNCGTSLNDGARFCHGCGLAVGGAAPSAGAGPGKMFWAPIAASLLAVVILVAVQFGSLEQAPAAEPQVLREPSRAPDISGMTPQEQADRLFDRVMRMASEGKTDSAAFFAPMALGAIEAIGPLDAHRRYDIGLIALVSGDVARAVAEADTILRARPTHLLGLVLAAKAADARGNATAAADYRKRLLAAESAERAATLPEYVAHSRDLDEALVVARKR